MKKRSKAVKAVDIDGALAKRIARKALGKKASRMRAPTFSYEEIKEMFCR
jgi:hypothetical protein